MGTVEHNSALFPVAADNGTCPDDFYREEKSTDEHEGDTHLPGNLILGSAFFPFIFQSVLLPTNRAASGPIAFAAPWEALLAVFEDLIVIPPFVALHALENCVRLGQCLVFN